MNGAVSAATKRGNDAELRDAIKRVARERTVGDRTMIDALAPALEALPNGMAAAAQAARQGADKTARILRAKAGRASYISEDRLSGHNDPGAEAVALLFEMLAKG